MSTTGKIPLLGFKAAAIKFVSLFGFTPNDVVITLVPISIPMTGSLTPIAMSGSGLATMTGSYGLDSLTGSVGD